MECSWSKVIGSNQVFQGQWSSSFTCNGTFNELSIGAKAGIGVGAGIGGVATIAAVIRVRNGYPWVGFSTFIPTRQGTRQVCQEPSHLQVIYIPFSNTISKNTLHIFNQFYNYYKDYYKDYYVLYYIFSILELSNT